MSMIFLQFVKKLNHTIIGFKVIIFPHMKKAPTKIYARSAKKAPRSEVQQVGRAQARRTGRGGSVRVQAERALERAMKRGTFMIDERDGDEKKERDGAIPPRKGLKGLFFKEFGYFKISSISATVATIISAPAASSSARAPCPQRTPMESTPQIRAPSTSYFLSPTRMQEARS